MLPTRVEVEASSIADRDEGGFELALDLAALRRHPGLRLGRDLPKIGLEHKIDDALGRGIAILQRDLFRENLDLGDRFGRDIAHRAKARDAPAVDQNHRASTPATTPRARLRLERSEERRGGQEGGSTCRSGWSP